MSLSTLINRPCTLIRRSPGSTDELGNQVDTETLTAAVCEIQQRQRGETPEAEWSKAQWVGFFLAGTQLDTGDAIRVDGLGTFELVGAPWPVRNPRTQAESHVEATLSKTAGAADAS